MGRRYVVTLTTAVTTAVAVVLAACGTPRTEGARVWWRSTSLERPASGQAVFEARCARCHTTTRTALVGPGLGGLFQRERLPNGRPVTDAEVRSWITGGGGRMPPQRLSSAELDTLLPYLKALE